MHQEMRILMKELKGTQGKGYGIINTHSLKRNWLKKMDKLLKKMEMIKVAEVDFRVGDGTEEGKGLEDGWETKLERFTHSLSSFK